MRNAAQRLVRQLALPSTLIVVFPALAMQPEAMLATMRHFLGSKLVVIGDADAPRKPTPEAVQDCISLQRVHADVTLLSGHMFGNQRGLMLPVDLVVEIVTRADLVVGQDRLLLTGCYRGDLPGSIDLLAGALRDLRFDVDVDMAVPRR